MFPRLEDGGGPRFTLLRGGGRADAVNGTGKSGIEPTEDSVVGREEEVAGVSGTESSDTLWFCGVYWNTGVWSWIREPSNMDGTILGRGGLWGGDRPAGGRYGSEPSELTGDAIGPASGH